MLHQKLGGLLCVCLCLWFHTMQIRVAIVNGGANRPCIGEVEANERGFLLHLGFGEGEDKLYDRCMRYEATEATQILEPDIKTGGHRIKEIRTSKKHIAPDVMAIIHIILHTPGFVMDKGRYYTNNRAMGLEAYTGEANRFMTFTGKRLGQWDYSDHDKTIALVEFMETYMRRRASDTAITPAQGGTSYVKHFLCEDGSYTYSFQVSHPGYPSLHPHLSTGTIQGYNTCSGSSSTLSLHPNNSLCSE